MASDWSKRTANEIWEDAYGPNPRGRLNLVVQALDEAHRKGQRQMRTRLAESGVLDVRGPIDDETVPVQEPKEEQP